MNAGATRQEHAGLVAAPADQSADVQPLDLASAPARNRLASKLGNTTSLTEVEDITRRTCGFSAIDDERTNASAHGPVHHAQITEADDDAIRTYEHQAASRGDYVTFRRIAEATDLGPHAAQDLRRDIITTRPARYAWPLWLVAAATPPAAPADQALSL